MADINNTDIDLPFLVYSVLNDSLYPNGVLFNNVCLRLFNRKKVSPISVEVFKLWVSEVLLRGNELSVRQLAKLGNFSIGCCSRVFKELEDLHFISIDRSNGKQSKITVNKDTFKQTFTAAVQSESLALSKSLATTVQRYRRAPEVCRGPFKSRVASLEELSFSKGEAIIYAITEEFNKGLANYVDIRTIITGIMGISSKDTTSFEEDLVYKLADPGVVQRLIDAEKAPGKGFWLGQRIRDSYLSIPEYRYSGLKGLMAEDLHRLNRA